MRTVILKCMFEDMLADMMYIAADGSISKRRIKVLQVDEVSFRAYCHLRGSNRTFTIENVLALVPIYEKEISIK